MKYSIEGNKVAALYPDLCDFQKDATGFGDSLKEAFFDLVAQNRPSFAQINKFKDWECVWWAEFHDNVNVQTDSNNPSVKLQLDSKNEKLKTAHRRIDELLTKVEGLEAAKVMRVSVMQKLENEITNHAHILKETIWKNTNNAKDAENALIIRAKLLSVIDAHINTNFSNEANIFLNGLGHPKYAGLLHNLAPNEKFMFHLREIINYELDKEGN